MEEKSYRLGQYEIILERNGGVWWKAHGGFADTKCGRCFIEGDVLFIGPSEVSEPGSLKNEFLERLKHLPQWDGTKYYCPSYTLHPCKGGRRLNNAQQPRATRRRAALTSPSPATGIKSMKGKLEKAFRRCKGLAGFNRGYS